MKVEKSQAKKMAKEKNGISNRMNPTSSESS